MCHMEPPFLLSHPAIPLSNNDLHVYLNLDPLGFKMIVPRLPELCGREDLIYMYIQSLNASTHGNTCTYDSRIFLTFEIIPPVDVTFVFIDYWF